MGTVWADTRTRQGRNAVLTQVMANNCVHFVTLAKDSPVISEKYAALLSVLKKKFENRFEGCKKIYQLTFETPFSVGINSLPVNFPMECIELQSDIQLKNLILTLYQIFRGLLLQEGLWKASEASPLLHSHALFMLVLFGSTHICEKYCQEDYTSLHGKSKISSEISDEHLENSLRIATTATEAAWCITVTKTRSYIPLVLCFCYSLFKICFNL